MAKVINLYKISPLEGYSYEDIREKLDNDERLRGINFSYGLDEGNILLMTYDSKLVLLKNIMMNITQVEYITTFRL